MDGLKLMHRRSNRVVDETLKDHGFIHLLKIFEDSGLRDKHINIRRKMQPSLRSKYNATRPEGEDIVIAFAGSERPVIESAGPDQTPKPYIQEILQGSRLVTEKDLDFFVRSYLLPPANYDGELLKEHSTLVDRDINISRENFLELGHQYIKECATLGKPKIHKAAAASKKEDGRDIQLYWKSKLDEENPLSVALFKVMDNHSIFKFGNGGVTESERYYGKDVIAYLLQGKNYCPKTSTEIAATKRASDKFFLVHESIESSLNHLLSMIHAHPLEILLITRAVIAGQAWADSQGQNPRGTMREESSKQREERHRVLECARRIHEWAQPGEPPEHVIALKRGRHIKSKLRSSKGELPENGLLEVISGNDPNNQYENERAISSATQLALLVESLGVITSSKLDETLKAIVDQSFWKEHKEENKTKRQEREDIAYDALEALLDRAMEDQKVWKLAGTAKENYSNIKAQNDARESHKKVLSELACDLLEKAAVEARTPPPTATLDVSVIKNVGNPVAKRIP